MGIIRQLSKEVVDRIAAGEVVERPASVVKELIENAIDAGAKVISINVSEGGKSMISVADDGAGMDAEDMGLSVLKHTTSKIRDESDLWSVGTMGFRGEALAAMGAVSRLVIESRVNAPGTLEGAKIEVEGGAILGPIVFGCRGGTRVVVSDIFFNVPARLKFLRSAAVEYGHISEVVAGLALACPDVRFELTGDGRRRVFANLGGVEGRVMDVLGKRFHSTLKAVDEKGSGISIRGWVAQGGRAGGKDAHIFLNRRPVRDRVIIHALTQGFGDGLSRGEYPACALWTEIDPAQVDVNVHPTKREVRFANSGAVHDFVSVALRKALKSGHASRIARHALPTGNRYVSTDMQFERRHMATEGDWQSTSFFTRDTRRETRDGLKPLGQLGSTYIICEGEDGALVIIDQHAAHERLGFDAISRQYSEGSVARQGLLIPEQVELSQKGLAYIAERADLLKGAGFEIEPFGGATLLVKAHPSILGDVSVAPLFERIAAELEELGTSAAVEDVLKRIFAAIACHRQVRGGERLLNEEMMALVRDIERFDITHCPHGRPAVVKIEKAEVEKWFKRK